MRTRFLSLLCVLALCFTLLPATAGAAGAGPDWTYDPEAQTLTSGDNTVTLYNVTAGGSSGTELTIGKNGSNSSGPMFNGSTLDLSGTITGTDSTPQYTITSIGDAAFYRCESLTSITLPEGTTSIGNSAFFQCTSLTSVDLSRCTNLTSIGEYAFSGCNALTSVDLSGCTNLTSIGHGSFSRCNALTSITLPEGVTSIGECAFQNCKELTSMSLLSKTPPTLGRYALKFFVREQDGTYPSFNLPKLTILVPLGSVEAYQAASGWSDYTGKIQAIPGTAAIACSPSSLTMTVGDTPSAITVTLTNTGMVELTNLAAALTGSGANAFTLDTLSVPSLAAGTSTTFLLTPHVGLAVGTYPVTVQVTSENLTAPVTASFTLTVTEPYVSPEDNSDPSYSVSLPGKVTGGTVTAKKSYAEEDETFRFAVTPDEGYELASSPSPTAGAGSLI